MIPNWLRNFAGGLFLLGSVGSIGIGAVDATGPEQCVSSMSAPSSAPKIENNSSACRDNIDGDAQDWVFGGLSGLGAAAGITVIFPGLGGAGGKPGRPSRTKRQPLDRSGRREREGSAEEDDANYEI